MLSQYLSVCNNEADLCVQGNILSTFSNRIFMTPICRNIKWIFPDFNPDLTQNLELEGNREGENPKALSALC